MDSEIPIMTCIPRVFINLGNDGYCFRDENGVPEYFIDKGEAIREAFNWWDEWYEAEHHEGEDSRELDETYEGELQPDGSIVLLDGTVIAVDKDPL